SFLVLAGSGTQTLGGTGQLIFACPDQFADPTVDVVSSSAGPLVLAAGVSVVNTSGSGTVGSSSFTTTVNGTVTASGGKTITVPSTSSDLETALTVNNAGASFAVQGGRNWITPNSGVFTNAGTLTIGSTSTFTTGVSFSQTSAGTLNLQLGGTTAGQFSK